MNGKSSNDEANADASGMSDSRELLASDGDDGEGFRNPLSQSRSPNQDDADTHALEDGTSNPPAASPLPLPTISEDESFVRDSQIAAAFEEMEEGSSTAVAAPLSSASLDPTPPPIPPTSAREGLETLEDDKDEGPALFAQSLLPHEEIEILDAGDFDTMDEESPQRRRERVRRQQEEILQQMQHPPTPPSPPPMDFEKKMDEASFRRWDERVRRQQEEILQQTQHPPTQAVARAPCPTPVDFEKKMSAASLQRTRERVRRQQEEIHQQAQDPPTLAGIKIGNTHMPDEMPPLPASQTAAAYKEMKEDTRRSIDVPPTPVSDEMPPLPAAQTAAAYKEMEQDIRRSLDAPPPPTPPMVAALTGATSEDEGEGQPAKKTTQTIEEDPQEDVQHPSANPLVRTQSLPAVANQREDGASPPQRTQSVILPIRPPPRSMMPVPHNDDGVRSTTSDPTLQVEAVLYEQDPVVYLGTPVENDLRPWWKKHRIPIAIAVSGLIAGSAVALWATLGLSREPVIASSQLSETRTILPSLEPSQSSPPSEIPSLHPTFHPSQSVAPSSVRSAPPSTSLVPSTSPSSSPSTPPSASALPTAYCFKGEINIFTDSHPDETSWTLSRTTTEGMRTATVVREGSPEDENSRHTHEVCLERGEYEFTIYDSFGDGICCDGGAGHFELVLDGWVVLEGGEFGSSQTVSFSLPADSLPPSQSSVPSHSLSPTFRPSMSFGPSSQVPSLGPTLSLRPSSLPSLLPTAPPSTYWSSLMWDQKGQTITGEASGDLYGRSIVLSGDGMTMAVGSLGPDGSYGIAGKDDRPGYVKVYRWEDNASRWQDLGQKIEGTLTNDQFGKGLALSEDGMILAIGAPGKLRNSDRPGYVRVYQIEGGARGSIWKQLGQDIEGEGPGDNSGYSVDLSSDGMTVAIGALFNDGTAMENNPASGLVRIYGWDEDGPTWKQLGQGIEREGPGDNSGYSVDLSSDGMTVAIGATLNDGNGESSGHVRVFCRKGDEQSWEQLGQDIDGEAPGDESGSSVSLSADGRTLAIGARDNDGNGVDGGHARVYRIGDAGGGWEQLGQDIDGEEAGDVSGELSLSADGKVLAIGAPYNGHNAGHVRIYRMEDGLNWKQVGRDIDGDHGDNAGYAVSLSADGKTVAIGSPFTSGNGFIKSGNVKVFAVNY